MVGLLLGMMAMAACLHRVSLLQGEGRIMEMLQERGLERDYGQMQEERLRCSACRCKQGEAAGRLVLEEEGMAL